MSEEDDALEAQLRDRPYHQPTPAFVGQANATDPSVYDRPFPEGFEAYAELLEWDSYWEETFDGSDPPFFEWFVGGELNAATNCIDRHLEDRGDQTALLWESEDGDDIRRIAYQDLYREVNETAAALRSLGVEEDDVVTLHMPMVPALPITMLACARIGAVHSQVFAGFSADALATRIDDAHSEVVVTIDGYYRRGEFLEHKQKADDAVASAATDVETVLVWAREDELDERAELGERDVRAEPLIAEHRGERIEPVSRAAEDPLFLMYTSGTTGEPKGCQHRTGGYLAWVTGTAREVLDIKPEDTYWCGADIGWITGHSYIVYGPLALGTTSVMREGAPDAPHRGVTWELAERYDVDIFHTSPTAVRTFMKWGEEIPAEYDFDFRLLTTVGEPIQPEAWEWYREHVGGGDAVVVDTWWQTETGGHLITNLPALEPMKPGSAGRPVPGIAAAVYGDDGESIGATNEAAGRLVIERPWPGMLQTIYGDPERFVDTYWASFSDTNSDDWRDWVYDAGDGAVREEDGFVRILGRLDDVMNVAGHRIGTMELESAIADAPAVAEAAVAAREHDEKGTVPDAYVIPREGQEDAAIEEAVLAAVEAELGAFARPANVIVTDELPKTRSGKIMRRLLEDISNDQSLGNTDTLRDPTVPERLRERVHGD